VKTDLTLIVLHDPQHVLHIALSSRQTFLKLSDLFLLIKHLLVLVLQFGPQLSFPQIRLFHLPVHQLNLYYMSVLNLSILILVIV